MTGASDERRTTAEVNRRGGAIRYRTIKTGPNTYRVIKVVPQAGPRGGHTVAGPEKRRKHPRAERRPNTGRYT